MPAGAAGQRFRHRQVPLVVALVFTLVAAVLSRSVAAATPEFDLARYRGKVVVVDFWASWCKPCRQSIPWLNEMRSRYASRGLVVIGINVDAERADADRFLRAVPADFDVVFDPEGSLASRFDVKGMPSSFVFGRDGQLISSHIGFREAQKNDREMAIQRVLSTSTP